MRKHLFASRSAAIEQALAEKLTKVDRRRLARECAKLDPKAERKLAEEGLDVDVSRISLLSIPSVEHAERKERNVRGRASHRQEWLRIE